MKPARNYLDYLESIEQYHLYDHIEHLSGDQLWQKQVTNMGIDIAGIMPAVYVLDLTRRKYLYVNESMQQLIGYRKEYLLDGGTAFGLTLWNQQDLDIFSKHIFTDNLRILKKVPVKDHSHLSFKCNYRVKAKNGESRNLLQQSVYITDPATGMPLLSIGSLSDISCIRNDGRIVHAVHMQDFNTTKVLLHDTYFSDLEGSDLTKRETEVLKWICEGLDSRTIAHKMHISLNTVNNHRSNIIAKTGCKKPVELYHYALRHGLL